MAKNKGFKGYKKEEDRYKEPTKGRGKPKYQNVVKDARVNTKSADIAREKNLAKFLDKPMSKNAISRRAGKKPNVAKQIDIENKERKGVRTAKPSTPKVPVKRSVGGGRGGVGRGGGAGGLMGSKIR